MDTNQASQLLAALQSVLTQVAKPSQVLKTILSQAVAQTGADRGVFVEVAGTGELHYRVLYRFESRDLQGTAGHYSRSIFAKVLESGEGLLVANALDDPRFMNQQSIQDFRLVSTLCMPIRIDGRVAALVHLENNKPDHFQPAHKQLLESMLEIAGPALGALDASQGVIRERDALRQAEQQAREELVENRAILARDWSFGRFIGRSAAVRKLGTTMQQAAATEFPVLLLGETGTGKSILARALHHASARAQQALITVFCPSLEKGMVETELFGHKRGAFTGAVADRVGKVQAAEGGTLFLDEIGELPLEIQPKLLRLLQEKTYERVGDHRECTANVRVVAATNRDLDEEVRAGRFRRDLFERLNYVPVRVPPLRERGEDIPLLLRHFLDQHEAGRWVELTDDAVGLLTGMDFTWPGNVRHVEHLAVRLSMAGKATPVTAADIRDALGESASEPGVDVDGADGSALGLEAGLPALLANQEKKWIEAALRRHPELTRAELSEKLKISESALYKKLRFYGISQ